MTFPFRMPIARIRDIDLAYDVRGEGDPILLVMGFSAQMVMWEEDFCDLLAGLGFRVIRFDNRDVGQSSKLDHLGVPNVRELLAKSIVGLPFRPPYTLEDMANDALGLLDHLGIDRCHVVGASMGGMIAQTMVVRAPHRLYSLTSIMSSPGGRRYSVGKPEALFALIKPAPRDREGNVEHFTALIRTISGEGYPFPEERLRKLGELQFDRGISPKGNARQFAAILDSDRRRRKLLPSIHLPTLVIHGTDDPLLPIRAGRATAKLIPGAQFLAVPGMGHDLPPDAFPLLAGAIATHARRSHHLAAKRRAGT